jgi:hypothetical protein
MRKKHPYLLCLLPTMVVFSLAAQQPKRPASRKEPDRELRALKHKIDLKGGVEITTAEKAADLAVPRSKYPQLHFVESRSFFKEYKDRSKTPSGLYILDSELIPPQLPEILKAQHLELKPDGTLVNAQGGKVSMVLWHKLVAVDERRRSQKDEENGWSLLPVVHAASPYPLSYVSAWGSWYADNGFCRSLTSTTGADAWGPLQNGARPHTFIQFIEARAWVLSGAMIDRVCKNCYTLEAQSVQNFGCFWPAYGTGTYSYADLKDGSFSWSWSWFGD